MSDTLDALFRARSAKEPDSPALCVDTERLTFAQLDARVEALAGHVRAARGGPDTPVGLCLHRSTDLIAGMLAILRAGAAYVPLDPAWPPDRIAFVLADSRSPAFLVTREHLGKLPPIAAKAITVDALEPSSPPAAPSATKAGNLAYVIYTSGSTGRPKGVMVEQRSVVNLARALDQAIYARHARRTRRVALNAPLAFDSSVKQWLMLLEGHTLHVLTDALRMDAHKLIDHLNRERIDVLDCTPSHLRALISGGLLERWQPDDGIVLVGGEAIDAALWTTLRAHQGISFYNVYGPTECTVDACIAAVRDHERPSIGRAVLNARVSVCGEGGDAVDPGAEGELCIGGAGVSRGYLNHPALTAHKFVPDASGTPGERRYKTGDRARSMPDGSFEFLGRADLQVKIRGNRVELEEIEARLLQSPFVKQAAVVLREDVPGERRLAGYVVMGGGGSVAQLKSYLQEQLPDYMVPAALVLLDQLPLTSNQKIDRAALPVPVGPTSAFVAPRSPIEEVLCAIWSELLSVEQVGIDDLFTDLGGHSLIAVMVVARVGEALGCELAVGAIFEEGTVARLAALLERQHGRTQLEESAALYLTTMSASVAELRAMVEADGGGKRP